jgi:signal transduction histidine kinase/CheY-like chemotaxis protein
MFRRVCSDGIATRKDLLKEQRYRLQFLKEDGRQRALILLALVVGYVGTARNDFLMLDGRPGLIATALACRFLLAVVSIATLLFFRRVRWPRQQDRSFYVALAAAAVLLSIGHLTRLPSGRVQGPLIGCSTLLVVLYFAGRGPVLPRAVFGGALSLGAAALILLPEPPKGIDPPIRLTALIAVGVLNAVGILSARSFELQRRQRFEAERREHRANRELEERLRELATEKERAEAMSRARAAFLAAMSHEFRTPMNAVIGLSDLVLDTASGPESRSHVRAINDSARALLRLLEDILDFAKIDAQKLTLAAVPFDLRRLSTSVIDMLRPAAASSVEISAEVAPTVPPRLLGDDARLRQVLVNLVGNAVKFTEHGAVRLRITARAAESPGDKSKLAISFRVEDTGSGMTPEVMARLFRPFEQGDAGAARRHGGTGLGLAISKQIVAAMGGEIHVESEPGRGSVFSFTVVLPAAEPEAEEPAPAAAPGPGRPRLAILVVDDQPLNREVARAKLGRLGYSADLVEDGAAALAAVARRDYDVVFMDLHMPGMNGLEATARIKETTAARRTPQVVAMTASVFEEDREACRLAGMVGFIGKPVDLTELDAVLTRVSAALDTGLPPAASLARESIDALREIMPPGDPHFFERVCRTFLTDTRQRLARMRAALARANAEELALEAHTLKSASAVLGATGMSEWCAHLEEVTRAGRLDGTASVIERLETEFVMVERAIHAELEGPPQAQEAS